MPRPPSAIAARRSLASSRRRTTSACMCAANTSTRPPPASLARDMATSALRSRCPDPSGVRERDADAGRQRHVPVGDPERLVRRSRRPAVRRCRRSPAALAALSISTANSSPPHRATVSCGGTRPRSRRAACASTRSPAPWPTESLTAVKPSRSTKIAPVRSAATRSAAAASPVACQQVLGPLLQVGAVRQPGQAVVEGQVGHLAAQRHLVADVPRGDQQLVRPRPGRLARHRGLHVPPGAVGRPDPAGEPARRRRRGARPRARPDHAGQVLRVNQLGQRRPVQLGRRSSRSAPRPGSRT